MAFADHYPFDEGDMKDLLAQAEALRAIPVTTKKDFVRIPPAFRTRVTVVTVSSPGRSRRRSRPARPPGAAGADPGLITPGWREDRALKTWRFRLEYVAVRRCSAWPGCSGRCVPPISAAGWRAASGRCCRSPASPAATWRAPCRSCRAAERDAVLRRHVGQPRPHHGRAGAYPGAALGIAGAEHLAPLAARGGPAILVSGHLANWEVLPPALAGLGIRMGSVYRAADNPAVDGFVNTCRAAAVPGEALPLFPKGSSGARAALASWRRAASSGCWPTRS